MILAIFTIAMASCKKDEQCYNCTYYTKGVTWHKGSTSTKCGADVKTNALAVEVHNKNMKEICVAIQ
mgnify:FL=1